jgi:hypothetical protein
VTALPSAAEEPRGLSRQDVFSLLGALGAVLTLVTAVMFYFGWQRSDVQAREMSVDVSLFGYSSQDYVLLSISSLYLPLLVLLGLGLGWIWVHGQVVQLLHSSRLAVETRRERAAAWSRAVSFAAAAVAVSCLVFALAAGTASSGPVVAAVADQLRSRQWLVPLVLVTSTLAAVYAGWISRQLRAAGARRSASLWQLLLPAACVAGAVILGAFWLLEEYAASVGRGYALQLANSVDRLAQAAVISPTPLGIQAPGVTESRLGTTETSDVRYRTTGLRLLARSGGKVLLVHDGWTPTTGTVIVLPDSEEFAWQFQR